MSTLNRRTFVKIAGASSLAAGAPWVLRAASKPHVVVVGGGFAGATAAKYLRLWAGGSLDVTLVDANPDHVSCVMSNLVLNERLSLSDITLSYDSLVRAHGVNVLTVRVMDVDRSRRSLRLDDGSDLLYDRLVLAPGIKFDSVPGLDSAATRALVPHAWIAGEETLTLRDQLRSMPAGGTYVLSIPKAPYRCPPGPYERACLVADLIRREKGAGKVVVLDENAEIVAERHTFERAFSELYGDIVEYVPDALLEEVSFEASGDDSVAHVEIAGVSRERFRADVLNVIPRHRAGQIVLDAGLPMTADGRWAEVDPLSYQSVLDDNVHVIGDSQATAQPKSGHIANAEAKICADAIVRSFDGEAVLSDTERAANVTTNSACFSPITYDTASWLTVAYRYDPSSGQMKLAPGSLGEARRHTRENFSDMFVWAQNLFADTFS